MDNARIHKNEEVVELIKSYGEYFLSHHDQTLIQAAHRMSRGIFTTVLTRLQPDRTGVLCHQVSPSSSRDIRIPFLRDLL